jgi:hypothetical protein
VAELVDVEPAAILPPASPMALRPVEPFAGDIVSPSLHHGRRPRRARDRLSTLVPLAGAATAVALIVGGYIAFRLYRTQRGGNGADGSASSWIINGKVLTRQGRQEPAFRLALTPDVWTMDTTKKALRAVVAIKRSDPDVWLAVAAQDYGVHRPRDSELLQDAVRRLEKYFGENLELAAKPEVKELAGRPAQALEFKGMADAAIWHGECYALTERGIGYWLFVAAATLEAARDTLAGIQQQGNGFALAATRDGWMEQPLPTETFKGTRCELKAAAGVWTKFKATDEDDRGDLFLVGRDQKETDPTVRNLKNATVLVLVLEKPQLDLNDALKLARDYLEMRKQEDNKDYKLVPSSAQEGPETQAIGDGPGKIVELKLLKGDEPRKYVLLAVAAEPHAVYVLRCECNWQHRQIWQSDFRDLLRTFRVLKAE